MRAVESPLRWSGGFVGRDPIRQALEEVVARAQAMAARDLTCLGCIVSFDRAHQGAVLGDDRIDTAVAVAETQAQRVGQHAPVCQHAHGFGIVGGGVDDLVESPVCVDDRDRVTGGRCLERFRGVPERRNASASMRSAQLSASSPSITPRTS